MQRKVSARCSKVVRCFFSRKVGEKIVKQRSIDFASTTEVSAAKKAVRTKEDERAKRWQLTENNPSYTKQEAVNGLASIGTSIYAVGSSEIGESGTKHIHAFVVYENAIKMGTLKKAFPRAHFEKCYGNNASNREYVIKDDQDFYEVGSMPITSERKQTSSENAIEVCALIMGYGKLPLDIIREYPQYAEYVVRNFSNLQKIYEASQRRK